MNECGLAAFFFAGIIFLAIIGLFFVSFVLGIIASSTPKKRPIQFLIRSFILFLLSLFSMVLFSSPCKNTSTLELLRENLYFMLLLFMSFYITMYCGVFIHHLFTFIFKGASKEERGNKQVAENTPHTKEKPNVRTEFIAILIISTVFLILSLIARTIPETKKMDLSQENNIFPSPTKQTISQAPITKKWVLKRKVGEKEERIATFTSSYTMSYLLRWNDYLFFYSTPESSKSLSLDPTPSIYGHNLRTGETKIIFDEEKDYFLITNPKYIKGNHNIFDMQIIDNALYFSLAGLLNLAEASMLYVNLPPENKPKKLIDVSAGSISKINGRYFIYSMRGGEKCTISEVYLLNTITKKATYITTSRYYCDKGDFFLGIDKKNRVIMSYHESEPDSTGYEQEYKYIFWLDSVNPTTSHEFLLKNGMPKGILTIEYLDNINKLLLLGKTGLYIFDLTKDNLIKVANYPEIDDIPYISGWNDSKACVNSSSGELNMVIDLLKETELKDDYNICESLPNPNLDPIDERLNEKFVIKNARSLLPSNYELVLE